MVLILSLFLKVDELLAKGVNVTIYNGQVSLLSISLSFSLLYKLKNL